MGNNAVTIERGLIVSRRSQKNARSRSRSSQKSGREPDLLDLIESNRLSEKDMTALREIMASRNIREEWRGQAIIPPDTLLDRISSLFRRMTDIPLEIPVFLTLHGVAAYLLNAGVTLKVSGTTVRPDLWTTILAESCAGKTLSQSVVEKIMPLPLLPNELTAAKFIEAVAENNRTAWFADEWAQVLKRINNQTYAEEIREYLLKIYDNKPIRRSTTKSCIEVEDPALVIVGTTVGSTFYENVTAEMMLDGFMQRFGYVIGNPDPARTPDMFPIYHVYKPENLAPCIEAWNALTAAPLHAEYSVSQRSEAVFCDAFRQMYRQASDVPTSFFRRVMWRSFKYALVFHFLLRKSSPEIDAEDIGWALRVSPDISYR